MGRILIVDDSIAMRRNLRSILSKAGHEVVGEAQNGQEAVRLFSELLPDLTTMDITMPIMDGIEAVKKIIADYPDAKIIMVSALSQKNSVFSALESGAINYIVKPINAGNILSIIDKALLSDKADNSVKLSDKKPQKDRVAGLVDYDKEKATSEIISDTQKEFEFATDKLYHIEHFEDRYVVKLSGKINRDIFMSLNSELLKILAARPAEIEFLFLDDEISDGEVLGQIIQLIKTFPLTGTKTAVTAAGRKIKLLLEESGITISKLKDDM